MHYNVLWDLQYFTKYSTHSNWMWKISRNIHGTLAIPQNIVLWIWIMWCIMLYFDEYKIFIQDLNITRKMVYTSISSCRSCWFKFSCLIVLREVGSSGKKSVRLRHTYGKTPWSPSCKWLSNNVSWYPQWYVGLNKRVGKTIHGVVAHDDMYKEYPWRYGITTNRYFQDHFIASRGI